MRTLFASGMIPVGLYTVSDVTLNALRRREDTMPNIARHRQILATLEPFVAEQTRLHESRQKLWFPSELLADAPQTFRLDPKVGALLVLNTLTEEGLPSFHRLLATNLGESPALVSWTDLWTAEEDRHGAVLHDYLLRVSNVNMVEVERMQYSYLRQGFRPHWQSDPYLLFAYTALQEWATQIAHQNISSELLRGGEPVLEGIVNKIAKEEAKHLAFYRSILAKLLEHDPDDVLAALAEVMMRFHMPGSNIPGFLELTTLSNDTKMFTPYDYAKIVRGTGTFLGLIEIQGLGDEGKRARDAILALPDRLEKIAARKVRFEMPRFPFLIT